MCLQSHNIGCADKTCFVDLVTICSDIDFGSVTCQIELAFVGHHQKCLLSNCYFMLCVVSL